MDKFDHSSHGQAMRAGVTQRTAAEQQQLWAQSFAACCDDVLGNVTHQGHAGSQSLRNKRIHFAHVRRNEGKGLGRAGGGRFFGHLGALGFKL